MRLKTAKFSKSDRLLGIRDILALNLKENRRICGLTQEKLAEKAGISAHYLAMVEVSRKFPTPEMLDRLAAALEIETYKLFDVSATPEGALLHLEQIIVNKIENLIEEKQQQTITDIKKSVIETIKETLSKENKNNSLFIVNCFHNIFRLLF